MRAKDKMGVLAITPSNEFAVHGLLPTGQRDPNPHVRSHDGPRDGPSTSHFIWDYMTGGAPLYNFPEHERQQVRGVVNTRYTAEQAAKNRSIAKRRLNPIAQGIKRAKK